MVELSLDRVYFDYFESFKKVKVSKEFRDQKIEIKHVFYIFSKVNVQLF